MPNISLMVRAAYVPYRQDVCHHEHTPYRASGGMPCTGPLVCTMCGMLFQNHAERDNARQAAKDVVSHFGPGWRLVTQNAFYESIGPLNVHPRVRGSYSDDHYGSDWIDLSSHRTVGKALQVGPHPATKPFALYFLPVEGSTNA